MRSDSRQQVFSWLHVLFGVFVTACLIALIIPLFLGRRGPAHRTLALCNAKALAGGLALFRDEQGFYPCDATRETLEEKGFNNPKPGTSANAYLSQLLVAEVIDREDYFFTPNVAGIHKGDDEMDTPGNILEKGENGFAYIMAAEGEPLNADRGIIPLVIAPIKRAGRFPVLDHEAYDGKYVYGAADGSAKTGKIGKEGQALCKGRAHLFESGPNSLFGSQIPVVRYPLGF